MNKIVNDSWSEEMCAFFTPSVVEWIKTVSYRPNSEPNLPRAKQFNERADTVAGFPASAMKGVIKKVGVAIIAM